MNILTFDTEEWYVEKNNFGNRSERYKIFDGYLKSILDLLDEQQLKATFFCVGGLAQQFPEVVKAIANRNHEIGCHSNTHVWLTEMNANELREDTLNAIKSLEDVCGKKVVSYRAPAFSIGDKNKWALEVLAECGIERDASIFPAVRDFGGFAFFLNDKPSIIKINGATLKEFPICLTKIMGKKFAYSGGGYFRFFPLEYIKNKMSKSDYVMTYFHIGDLEHHELKLMNKEMFEEYFKIPGTLKNRILRMIKTSLGTKGAFDKMVYLVKNFDYVNISEADNLIDWRKVKVIEL